MTHTDHNVAVIICAVLVSHGSVVKQAGLGATCFALVSVPLLWLDAPDLNQGLTSTLRTSMQTLWPVFTCQLKTSCQNK